MSGFGHSGPHAEYRSYGPVVQAVSGLSYISGLPGREPSGWGLSYMDNQAAYYNSAAILFGIYRRNLTGKGTEIDVSALEVGINLVGPVLLDVSVNHHTTRRPDYPTGNRLEWPHAAPHGVYPGGGRRRVGRHRRLRRPPVDRTGRRRSVGRPGPQDPRFASAGGPLRPPGRARRATSRTGPATRNRHEMTELLQVARRTGRRGAERRGPQRARPADRRPRRVLRDGPSGHRPGPVRGQPDPVLRHGGRTTGARRPLLGEDNDYVFRGILGMDDAEYVELMAEGVI